MMSFYFTIVLGVLASLMLWTDVPAQDPSYAITQSVIANGGGKSDGSQFSVTGTVGQAIAGTNSSGPPFSATGGFWQHFLSPTAALVSISGRVTTSTGQPISRVVVMIEGSHGGLRSAVTGTFGHFRIDNIEAGQTYILSALHKRHQFVPQVISVNDGIGDLVILSLN